MIKASYFLRVVIAALFISAGIAKAFLIDGVAREISDYQLVPAVLVDIAAIGLILFEIVIGIWLLTGKRTNLAAYLSIGLLCLFMVAKISALIRGLELSCNVCYGALFSLPLWANMILNIGMIAGLLLVLYGNKSAKNNIVITKQTGDSKAY